MRVEADIPETTGRDGRFFAFCGSFSRGAGAFIGFVGALTLLGWFLDLRFFLWTSPHQIVMKANAALCFVLSGLSLWLLAREGIGPFARRIAGGLALLVALLGLLTLAEYLTGWNPGIDQMLAREAVGAVKTASPGRMAPNAALNFALLGTCLLLLALRRGYRAVSWMAVVAGSVALLALLGYAYADESLTGFFSRTHIALQTALAFCLLAAGVIFAMRDRGIMEPFSRESAGGLLARRLVPALIVIPLLLDWMRHWGEHRGLFGDEFGVAIMVVANAVVLGTVAWRSAVELNRSEAEKKRAEEALVAEQAFRRAIEEAVPSGIAVTDPSGRLVYVNPSLGRMAGWTGKEILGTGPPFPFWPPESGEEIAALHRKAADGLLPSGFEMPIRRRDDGRIDTLVNSAPVRNAEGRTVGLLTSYTDITLRKRQELELARTSEILERIFTNMQFMVVYLDARFNFIRVNRAYADSCGYPPDFFPGRNHFDLYPHEENEAIFRRVVETGEPFNVYAKPFEFPDHPERGVTYWDWSLLPVKAPDGTVTGLVFCLGDVTERVRAEARERRGEERLEMALAGGDLGLWDWNFRTGEGFFNERWSGMLGYPQGEIEPRHDAWERLVHPEDFPRVKAALAEHLGGRTPIYQAEFRMRSKTGEWRWIHARGKVFERDDRGFPVRATGIHQDVTLAKEMEQAALRQEKMAVLGQMAAGIAHEIRNPLSGLNIYLTAAETLVGEARFAEPESAETAARALASARQASVKIEGVIRRVMDFVKPTPSRLDAVNVNETVREALELAAVTLRKSGIGIETRLAESLPPCRADSRLIEQLILNLVTNAVQAVENTEGEKRIEVSTGREGDRLVIRVADSGPGIPDAQRERIFEPFFTTKSAGTGLGLSISRRIIAAHGGSIEVAGSRLGGAEFRVLLPVEESA